MCAWALPALADNRSWVAIDERIESRVNVPGGYAESTTFDLGQDKTINAGIQVSALLVAGLAVGLVFLLDLPVSSGWSTWLLIVVTAVLCVLYMAVHELTHGVAIRVLSGTKPTYRLRFPFLTTGSDAYLARNHAIVIALAPAVVWGIVLVGLLMVVPQDVFLSVYVVTALNFAGSTGDYFQAGVFARLSRQALIQDDGEQTRLFLPV